jgi:hypothetical protein
MQRLKPSDHEYRKSSYSTAKGTCVEVATTADVIAVRDSKDPTAPSLLFNYHEWQAFIKGVKAGEFDCG